MNVKTRNRRRFLADSARAAAGLAVSPILSRAQAPAVVNRESAGPSVAALSAGDVRDDRAVIWSRSDRPGRMIVEWSTTESFRDPRRVRGSTATAATGFTARVDLTGLPADQRLFYRARFEDSRAGAFSSPATLLSAPRRGRDVVFAFSADTVGQGWGINEAFGGLRMYETIRLASPDFFVHCGDTIYADGPLAPEVKLDDGTIWRNLVTPAKSKVAETLEEFRGNYAYNLLDENVRRFNAEVPQVVLWDDHEVKNNWYPGLSLDADDRYTEKDSKALIARARQAFLEFSPIAYKPGGQPPIYRSCRYGPRLEVFAIDLRTYRAPNSGNRQEKMSRETEHAGARQLSWLKRALLQSTATWKVIASDLPIGLIVPDGPSSFEAIANGDGPPLGRELEVADLLRFIQEQRIRNIIWITGDVHYAAAHHYHPDRARFKEFLPFWEFVAGPLHAGTFGPNRLDSTFGPEVRFSSVPPNMAPNRPPSEGLQFFGLVRIDGASGAMTVELKNLAGRTLFSVDLEPEP